MDFLSIQTTQFIIWLVWRMNACYDRSSILLIKDFMTRNQYEGFWQEAIHLGYGNIAKAEDDYDYENKKSRFKYSDMPLRFKTEEEFTRTRD